MLKKNPPRPRHLKNEKGMAMIEAVPLLVIFIMLLTFGLGFYGAIHTATLNSIGARAYAFETFRQRSNLVYFREDDSGLNDPMHYKTKGFRFHAVSSDQDYRNSFVATVRPMTIGRMIASDADANDHNREVYNIERRNQSVETNPMWIMVGYGICIDAGCGR